LINKVTRRLPEFIDEQDKEIIESAIDTMQAELRQKREAVQTAIEIQLNYQNVRFVLTIE